MGATKSFKQASNHISVSESLFQAQGRRDLGKTTDRETSRRDNSLHQRNGSEVGEKEVHRRLVSWVDLVWFGDRLDVGWDREEAIYDGL